MTDQNSYTHIADLHTEVALPEQAFKLKPIFQDKDVKAVLFHFLAGSELAEHTAPMPIIIQVVSGQGRITIGSDSIKAKPGTWVHVAPDVPHSINATENLIMLLTLIKSARPGSPDPAPLQ